MGTIISHVTSCSYLLSLFWCVFGVLSMSRLGLGDYRILDIFLVQLVDLYAPPCYLAQAFTIIHIHVFFVLPISPT